MDFHWNKLYWSKVMIKPYISNRVIKTIHSCTTEWNYSWNYRFLIWYYTSRFYFVQFGIELYRSGQWINALLTYFSYLIEALIICHNQSWPLSDYNCQSYVRDKSSGKSDIGELSFCFLLLFHPKVGRQVVCQEKYGMKYQYHRQLEVCWRFPCKWNLVAVI